MMGDAARRASERGPAAGIRSAGRVSESLESAERTQIGWRVAGGGNASAQRKPRERTQAPQERGARIARTNPSSWERGARIARTNPRRVAGGGNGSAAREIARTNPRRVAGGGNGS